MYRTLPRTSDCAVLSRRYPSRSFRVCTSSALSASFCSCSTSRSAVMAESPAFSFDLRSVSFSTCRHAACGRQVKLAVGCVCARARACVCVCVCVCV
jgi:hypothetical protein